MCYLDISSLIFFFFFFVYIQETITETRKSCISVSFSLYRCIRLIQANSNRSPRTYYLLHEGSPFSLPLQVCARLKLLTFVWASRRHEFSKNFAIRYFEMVTVGQILNPPQSRRDSFNIKLPLLSSRSAHDKYLSAFVVPCKSSRYKFYHTSKLKYRACSNVAQIVG